jgi:hypothetical protein
LSTTECQEEEDSTTVVLLFLCSWFWVLDAWCVVVYWEKGRKSPPCDGREGASPALVVAEICRLMNEEDGQTIVMRFLPNLCCF